MTRLELTEQMRRMRHEERRCPIENAALALAALCGEDRTRAIERFNAIFKHSKSVPIIVQKDKPQ